MDEIHKLIQDYKQYNLGLKKLGFELSAMPESERLNQFAFYEEHFLRSDRATRITEDAKRSLVSSTFPSEVDEAIMEYPAYRNITGKAYSTYLLTCHESNNFGAVYRIIPGDPGVNGSDQKIGIEILATVRELVEDYINSFLPSNKFFILDKVSAQKVIRLVDTFGFEPEIDLNIQGASSGLPLFMLYLSLVTGIQIPVNIAMTGEVDPNLNILRVDGIKQKIEAVRTEYTEVTRLIVPENNIFEIGQIYPGLQISAVNTVDEAVKLIFGDISDVIAGLTNGVISFEKSVRDVEFTRRKGETPVKMSANFFSLVAKEYPMNIPTKILRKLDLAKETAESFTVDQGIYVLDNVRPLWYASFLASKFFNKVAVYATVNTGVRKHAIVVYCKEESGFRAGDILYF